MLMRHIDDIRSLMVIVSFHSHRCIAFWWYLCSIVGKRVIRLIRVLYGWYACPTVDTRALRLISVPYRWYACPMVYTCVTSCINAKHYAKNCCIRKQCGNQDALFSADCSVCFYAVIIRRNHDERSLKAN